MFKFVTTVSKISKREQSILAFDANKTKRLIFIHLKLMIFFSPLPFIKIKHMHYLFYLNDKKLALHL